MDFIVLFREWISPAWLYLFILKCCRESILKESGESPLGRGFSASRVLISPSCIDTPIVIVPKSKSPQGPVYLHGNCIRSNSWSSELQQRISKGGEGGKLDIPMRSWLAWDLNYLGDSWVFIFHLPLYSFSIKWEVIWFSFLDIYLWFFIFLTTSTRNTCLSIAWNKQALNNSHVSSVALDFWVMKTVQESFHLG